MTEAEVKIENQVQENTVEKNEKAVESKI